MELVCGIQPGQFGFYCNWCGDRRCTLGRAPAIRRSIWADPLSFPSRNAGHLYVLEFLCLFLFGDMVLACVRADVPVCLSHMVAEQLYHVLVV